LAGVGGGVGSFVGREEVVERGDEVKSDSEQTRSERRAKGEG
jgi:hypothetical protein